MAEIRWTEEAAAWLSDIVDGEIRILLYGHYRIAYLVKPDLVEILGVFHGALDIQRYIQQ